MAEVATPSEMAPTTNEAQPHTKRPADAEAEGAAQGAERQRLVQVDSGALEAVTDGESSGSDDSFFPDDADAADVSVLYTGRTAEEVISTEQLCQRRLENVRQLKELYEVELLNTMEEQRSRQSRSRKSAPGNQEGTEGSEPVPYKPLKELLLQRSSARGAAPAQLAAPQAVPGQERAQAPQQAGEEAGVPSLSEAEEVYNAMPGGAADVSHLRAERQRSRMRLGSIARLEQAASAGMARGLDGEGVLAVLAASAGTARALDRAGALAVMVSARGRYLVKRSAVTLGRTTSTHGKVDVDLSPEHFAAKVSRQQGRLYLRPDGTFRLTNTGRRKFLVNNCQVKRGDTAVLPHLSLVEIDNVRLLLMVNHLAVRRLLARSATFGDFPGN